MNEGEAIVYDLAAGVTTLLGVLQPNGTWSRAIAITDGPDAIVVGESDGLDICPDECEAGQNPPPQLWVRSFHTTLDGGTPVLNALSSLGCDTSSLVRDVSRALGLRIPGSSASRHLTGPACLPFEPTCPTEGKDSVAWTPALVVLPDLDQPPIDRDSESRGVNTAGQLVGWGVPHDVAHCDPDALFWDSAFGLFNLGANAMPAGQVGDPSRAEAINNLPLPQVVGWNLVAGSAVIWENQGPLTNWIAKDLNVVTALPGVTLNQAFDINDDGWIIAWGTVMVTGGAIERHAYLLTPLGDCPADIAGAGGGPPDCEVGINDFLKLLGNWGDCPPEVICDADIDGDGLVGITDFLGLLAAWGPCPTPCVPSGVPVPSLQEEIEAAGLVWPDDWDTFVNCMTSGTQADQDNCLCWMTHYLEGCDGLFCEAPNCPGADPFLDPPPPHFEIP